MKSRATSSLFPFRHIDAKFIGGSRHACRFLSQRSYIGLSISAVIRLSATAADTDLFLQFLPEYSAH